MIVVVDTNVIVSSVINKSGYSAIIRKSWKEGKLTLATSASILAEVERVLAYPHVRKRHQWSSQHIRRFAKGLQRKAVTVSGSAQVQPVKNDPTDNKFFACAKEARAEYIVSGDEHVLSVHSYQGVKIVTPKVFVEKVLKISKAA